ncbi:MAG: hypothetical protein M1818_005577 [Claussenomyces sp. TS43310]|nr:MAG: hypothetical protein M1818_005577 [Claussenomyces sp. TS43310]
MQFSRPLKSSAHSLPSGNGAYIATILPFKAIIRQTRSLEIVRAIPLPDSASSIQWFLWSPSSERFLLSAAETIRIYSVTNNHFGGVISNPTSGTAKTTYVAFGETDDEVVVFSDFGLKVTIFNLSTSTSIEIPSPKFFNPIAASRGYAYRPRTSQCALLTRTGGKDILSIHGTQTYEVVRSWHSDTIDAQSLSWSPDGRWLAVVESAGHGPRILVYTADGHLYKIWKGPLAITDDEKDASLGAGVKILHWTMSSDFVAVGDHSSKITLLSTPSFSESMTLNHSNAVRPANGFEIWQEQVAPSPNGGFERNYAPSTQITCPPTTTGSLPAAVDAGSKVGTAFISSDTSGTLIATRSEHMPTTVWIWDIASKMLKALMVQHAPVARVTWHPSINELLMIRCEGEESKGLVYLWEPTWDAPKIVNFGSQLPDGKIIGKSVIRWLNCEGPMPALFFSDTQDCMLAALSDGDADPPWHGAVTRGVNIYGEREESPLDLVPADEKQSYGLSVEALMNEEPTMTHISGEDDEMDDTFRFRRFVGS